jgi:transcriptional regulator with XRE-family HTH domain
VSDDTFGRRLRALRRARGLLQEDVGEKLGVASNAVSLWERDQGLVVSGENLLKLCDWLGPLPMVWLLFGDSGFGRLGEQLKTGAMLTIIEPEKKP